MKTSSLRRRSGHFVTLTAAMLVGTFGMVAFAVDLGYLHVVRTEMQRAADSTAIAATWELIDPAPPGSQNDPQSLAANVATVARRYAELNRVAGGGSQLAEADITVGRLANPTDPASAMTFDDPARFNAVTIRLRRNAEINGEVPLFFAKVLGVSSAAQESEATAAFLDNFSGFRAPTREGEYLEVLPIALDEPTWESLKQSLANGGGVDNWRYDPDTGAVTAGSDGVPEVNLYPNLSVPNSAAGNRGTVDIGSPNNSTADLARQILHGVTKADLDYIGGALKLDANGQLLLNGDPGISAGIKDELAAIKGKARIIPIFESVCGPGNNATYVITGFGAVRILDVKLTGSMSSKRVTIQPARMKARGAIPATDGTQRSDFIYSPVWLVR